MPISPRSSRRRTTWCHGVHDGLLIATPVRLILSRQGPRREASRVPDLVLPGDVVLVKASRGLKLEAVVDALVSLLARTAR